MTTGAGLTWIGVLIFGVPLLILILVIAAVLGGLWLIARGSRGSGGGLEADRVALQLYADLQELNKRVETLETLLIERVERRSEQSNKAM